MEKIANLKDLKKGKYLTFNYKGRKAILVRPKHGNPKAYIAVCPHEAGDIEWDEQIGRLLCECHGSIFNISDGSVEEQSSVIEPIQSLTQINLSIDDQEDIFAL